jgi:hypothetical protein
MATVAERHESKASKLEVNEETGIQNGNTKWSSDPSSKSTGNESLSGDRTTFKAHCEYCKVATKPHWQRARERSRLGSRSQPST